MEKELYTMLFAFMWRLLGLQGSVKEVFAVIWGFWRRDERAVAITNHAIHEITGLAESTIITAKNTLLRRKIISVVERRGKPSIYDVHLPIEVTEYWRGIYHKPNHTETRTPSNPVPKNNNNTNQKKKNGNQSINVGNREEFEIPDRL